MTSYRVNRPGYGASGIVSVYAELGRAASATKPGDVDWTHKPPEMGGDDVPRYVRP